MQKLKCIEFSLTNTNLLRTDPLLKFIFVKDAWIITGGTNKGVMKYVGKAVKEHRHANGVDIESVLGIATWGVIHKNHRGELERTEEDVGTNFKKCKNGGKF